MTDPNSPPALPLIPYSPPGSKRRNKNRDYMEGRGKEGEEQRKRQRKNKRKNKKDGYRGMGGKKLG